MSTIKARKLEMIKSWIESMVLEGSGQFGSAERRFVESYRMTFETCLETMTVKQLQATLSLIACANGLGHAQYRNQARSNNWAPRQTPAIVLKLVRS